MVPTSSLILREKAKDTGVRQWGVGGHFSQLFNQLLVVGDSEFPFFLVPTVESKVQRSPR